MAREAESPRTYMWTVRIEEGDEYKRTFVWNCFWRPAWRAQRRMYVTTAMAVYELDWLVHVFETKHVPGMYKSGLLMSSRGFCHSLWPCSERRRRRDQGLWVQGKSTSLIL